MSTSIYTGDFWRAAFERGIKSIAWSLGSVLIGNGTGLIDTDWIGVLSVAGMAGLLSILGSIASDAGTGGTGPSLTSSETLAGLVTVTAPAEAQVDAEIQMPADARVEDEACTDDHPDAFKGH